MKRFVRYLVFWLTSSVVLTGSYGRSEEPASFDAATIEFFETKVRPILVERCSECHSGGEQPAKGGLHLDSRDAILRGGDTGPAVTLETPATSLFLSAINYGDIYQMPPKSKLPSDEIAILTKWIETGLAWPQETSSVARTVKTFDLTSRAREHWCWQPVKEYAPPDVRQTDWPRSTVDNFILAKLESNGLLPAQTADRRSLIRRLSFDLIGLPPSPEEVEEFVCDPAPNADEKVVDRLLASSHFGERWGRHWLDLTRYAETRGHEFDPIIPNAWQYRDYVIRAFNADLPYDQFLTEQIAGDLTEPRWRQSADQHSAPALPINESLLGTGFWFLGEEVHSPVDIRKDETDRMDNRIDVVSKTFLGLTVACARCHDHKFDAISQRDYYALAGYAISSSYRQIRVDTYEHHRQIAVELDELRSRSRQETTKAIRAAILPGLAKLDAYWFAAKQAIDATTSLGTPSIASQLQSGIVERIATEKGLDAGLLTRWYAELNAAQQNERHPLHGLFAVRSANSAINRETATDASKAAIESIKNAPTPSGIVADFGDPTTNLLMQDGVSFGLRPVARGQLVIDGPSDAPRWRVATIGGWQRDLFWKKNALAAGTQVDHGTLGRFQSYGQMVRTPEFTLTTRNVWYLVKGSVRAYAAVNSHLVIAGPLHGALLREYQQSDDQWHWVLQELDSYQGHRLHVEFSPIDETNCTIAMVVQSDEAPPLPESDWTWLNELARTHDNPSSRFDAYHKAFQTAFDSIFRSDQNLQEGTSNLTASATADPQPAWPSQLASQAYLADWVLTHPQLFSLDKIELPSGWVKEAESKLAKQVVWESSLAPAILDGNGVDEYLLVRGNSNAPKEPVSRRFLEVYHDSVLGHSDDRNPNVTKDDVRLSEAHTSESDHKSGPSHAEQQSSGRLGLAREILRSPLAARVAVNRIWHHLFGRGIVPTVDNFGLLGQPPSHPELLDHLAGQFAKNGWSTKAMIRSLVLSRTYQMSSHPTDSDAADPANALWHRMSIKRLEGEAIRDSLLAVAGRLDVKMFGPSVPIHLTQFMQGRGRPGDSGPLDGNGRRSLYIAVRRNFLSPMMLAFDTPSPFSTVGRRTVSNVPAQALILMNDPFVMEQAKHWADRLLAKQSDSTDQRLDRLYLTAFARHPTPDETAAALNFLKTPANANTSDEREAWSNLCHVMLNVKEFIFID